MTAPRDFDTAIRSALIFPVTRQRRVWLDRQPTAIAAVLIVATVALTFIF